MRQRRPEHPHDRVTDELLHRPPEALDLVPHARVVAPEAAGDVLRVGTIRGRVNPTRSMNRTLTTFRSSTADTGGASVRGAAKLRLQNFAVSGFSAPQEGQTATGRV